MYFGKFSTDIGALVNYTNGKSLYFKVMCQQFRAYLAEINNEEEDNFLHNIVNERDGKDNTNCFSLAVYAMMMFRFLDEFVDGWMDGFVDGWMGGQRNGKDGPMD